MFAPQQEQQRPFAVYDQFIPTIEIPGAGKRFSPAAYQNLFAPTSAISYGPNVRMPVQQVYNINLPGPTGTGHAMADIIYENYLPGKDAKFTSTTIGERLQMWDYVRQILIRINDGEDISIDSGGHNNLMSYIKFMELNPNYYSPISNNPYRGLPYGLLIYRSCFPIRLNQNSQSVGCAKNSMGLNIRLYALTSAEYFSYKFRQSFFIEYDVWRELAYYEYVRENIIKKKQSPNFPLLYAFFMSPNKNIDFYSLKKGCLTQKDLLTKEYQNFVKMHTTFPTDMTIREYNRPMETGRNITKLPDEIDPSLQLYSGTTLILITEAPHSNLYQWASRIYEKDGIVRKMISDGFYDEKIWLSVLFQIVSALYVLQIHGIYIRNMTIQDNVYIKDLQSSGRAMGYWKYVIEGVPYYIPNYGYLVFIDTNFKDIIPENRIIEQCKRQYKIYTCDIFGKKYNSQTIKNKIFQNYRNIVNTNSFSKEHTQNNVMRPPESVMRLIDVMMNDPETDIGKVIFKYFRNFMNNRIGTLLRRDTEVPNIREVTSQFTNGELAVEVLEDQLYRWCMVVNTKNDGVVEIVTKDNPKSGDYITKEVRIETLKKYSQYETVEQNSTQDVNLSENDLLETYIVSY
uniref:Uncharacterized protein n=1 Tax=Borely moumouvirus TaxID=2712067 RepID=A0A6G6AC37_9VIRU